MLPLLLWFTVFLSIRSGTVQPGQPAQAVQAIQAAQAGGSVYPASVRALLLPARSSEGDLEVGGELNGLPAGTTRYVRYQDLLSLPQESYTISDDTNFKGETEISGVALTTLARLFGQAAHSDLIVAICYDKYRSNYPSDYLAAHHPIVVLKINGQLRDKWPPSEYGGALGPYLISHPTFKPSFSVLSHKDEAQIPFGVTRLDFRTESVVFGAIRPNGRWAKDSPVSEGYQIARQDCFRCHGLYGEGGDRASRSWLVLSAWAATDPERFQQYIHEPQSVQSNAKMPAHGDYDQATLAALTAYFKTFAPVRKSR
jgi:mono/diheme cytochrome c family protein